MILENYVNDVGRVNCLPFQVAMKVWCVTLGCRGKIFSLATPEVWSMALYRHLETPERQM